ncbi:MAG: hypothetical protein CL607_02005 [Anaerolineaceae bacterium]|nr:hypothetical protein [Anaerolineaceae bacterium]
MKAVNWEAKSTIGLDFQLFIDYYTQAFIKVRIAIITVFNPRTQKLIQSGLAHDSLYVLVAGAEEILYGYDSGKELRDSVSQTTTELTAKLSKYTFGKSELLRLSIANDRKTHKDEIVKTKSVDNSAKDLADAQERLSAIESSYRTEQHN